MTDQETLVPFAPRAEGRAGCAGWLTAAAPVDDVAGCASGPGWSAGVDVDELRELVAYWTDGFNWRAAEERLNCLPRFRTRIDGVGIHLVHARARAYGLPAMPLLLAHG